LFSANYVQQAQQEVNAQSISTQDLLATLSAFTAEAIIRFVKTNINGHIDQILLSGGGAKNTFIVGYLQQAFPGVEIADTSTIGINADAKEAILFALLANEALVGEPIVIGNNPAVLMGKFSFPM
jgi:anhydro-N-acetylmuramic acid kinase